MFELTDNTDLCDCDLILQSRFHLPSQYWSQLCELKHTIPLFRRKYDFKALRMAGFFGSMNCFFELAQ